LCDITTETIICIIGSIPTVALTEVAMKKKVVKHAYFEQQPCVILPLTVEREIRRADCMILLSTKMCVVLQNMPATCDKPFSIILEQGHNCVGYHHSKFSVMMRTLQWKSPFIRIPKQGLCQNFSSYGCANNILPGRDSTMHNLDLGLPNMTEHKTASEQICLG
jgi:hypothetical protein